MKKLNNDQIKLLADTAKGLGLSWIVGGVIAPILRPDTPFPYIIMVILGVVLGAICVVFALGLLTLTEDA